MKVICKLYCHHRVAAGPSPSCGDSKGRGRLRSITEVANRLVQTSEAATELESCWKPRWLRPTSQLWMSQIRVGARKRRWAACQVRQSRARQRCAQVKCGVPRLWDGTTRGISATPPQEWVPVSRGQSKGQENWVLVLDLSSICVILGKSFYLFLGSLACKLA